ncbi:methylated-DNA--[protein]-cysteine S-methyltransferase [Fodinicola feengrottensis]|uniref:Methylated-DNA--protein-cysteine methyltransferase n=1 Tax=Fodinicola feengrottensis TaxID=435914 RepID=A0ABN2IVY6_9ACTN|nr:methylated-DNA--[protein]-cysteine S-methyltransferase [Fodinicola feengrottensis]
MGWTTLPSPIGAFGVIADENVVRGASFGGRIPAGVPRAGGQLLLDRAVAQLRSYFAGELLDFDLPLSLAGSDFELKVWEVLRRIPYGQTVTYGWVAAQAGDPLAARAVGTACNHNPIPVIVPCHRVVGANKTLVGFGGGLPRKRWLLEHEARVDMERAFAF